MEVWLKYGKTMVFTDLEDSFEILQPKKAWDRVEETAEKLAEKIDDNCGKLVVDYVHGVAGLENVLESVVKAFQLRGLDFQELEVLVSSWRYGDLAVEKSLSNIVKSLVAEWNLKKVSQTELSNDALSDAVVVSPSVYWDGSVVCYHDFFDYVGFHPHSVVVSPVAGYGGVVVDVLVGENIQRDALVQRTLEAASYTASNNPQIIVAGCPGYPTDSKLLACINLASAVINLQPNKVVIFAMECSEGLGPKTFTNTLLGKEQNVLFEKRVDAWKTAVSKHKVCLVTALPSTIVNEILGARQCDTLDQAIVYGRRVKSREANVLFAENVLGTMLTGF
ncbi:MAG: hypothetical protein RMI49_03415 [Candidatus Caldarchaeum sp.]|nr:hypothetical protein [Candidatus Caldarchaeum sp.]